MPFKFANKIIESEKLPWITAYFYNLLPARMLRPTYQYIANTLPLKNNGVLVDIGTGPGDLVKLIAQKYPNLKVIGIDLSGTMIKIAGKKREKLANLEFKIMDGKKLEFPGNSIDYAISTLTFHHWKDPLKVLNEIYRVLKKGGSSFIYDGYSGASDEDIDKSLEYPLKIKLPKIFIRKTLSWHGFSKKEYENCVKPLIEKSNFKKSNFKIDRICLRIELRK